MSLEHSPGRAGLARKRGAVADEGQPPRARTLIRWPEVFRIYKKSRTQTWRDIRAGNFPAPVKIGPNSVAWFEDEVAAKVESLQRVDYAPDADAA